MKSAVPASVAVGCRFSAQEHLAGGLQLEDTIEYARALERSGVDYLSVSTGVYASFVRIIPPMDFAPGWLLGAAAAVKRSVSVPVIGVSRIVDPLMADAAVSRGDVDLIALGRALLTDPEWPNKARDGRLDEIVWCIGCNQGCEARISRQRDVTCLVNPQVGREPGFGIVKAPRAKNVVVVGGGPAGLEVARTCAERGHAVRLFERAPHLGGALALAAELPERPGWQIFLRQSERRARAAGVDIRLGEEVGADELAAQGADSVVLATGARFVVPGYTPSSPSVVSVDTAGITAWPQTPSGPRNCVWRRSHRFRRSRVAGGTKGPCDCCFDRNRDHRPARAGRAGAAPAGVRSCDARRGAPGARFRRGYGGPRVGRLHRPPVLRACGRGWGRRVGD